MREHVLPADSGPAIAPDQGYFQIRVNRVQLAKDRIWVTRYDPLVLVSTEYLYGTEEIAIPYALGPSTFEARGMKVGLGASVSDIGVAGPAPWRGGTIRLRVALYRVARENVTTMLLKVAESVSGVLAPLVPPLAETANVVMAGTVVPIIEALVGQQDAVVPSMAFVKEFSPGQEGLRPAHLVLLDRPEVEVSSSNLWISAGDVHVGTGPDDLVRFDQADFVHLSLVTSSTRADIAQLPFYSIWLQALREAIVPGDKRWQVAKANLLALYEAMLTSPDLAQHQVDALLSAFVTELQAKRQRAIELSKLGVGPDRPQDTSLERIAEILELTEGGAG